MKILIDLDEKTLKKVDELAKKKRWFRKNTIEWIVEEKVKE